MKRMVPLLLSLLPPVLSKECRVYSGLGQPCIFPYKWDGQFYAECTTKFGEQ